MSSTARGQLLGSSLKGCCAKNKCPFGQMSRRTDGQVSNCTNGHLSNIALAMGKRNCKDGQMYNCTNEQLYICTNGQKDIYTNGQIYRCTDVQVDRCINGQVSKCTNGHLGRRRILLNNVQTEDNECGTNELTGNATFGRGISSSIQLAPKRAAPMTSQGVCSTVRGWESQLQSISSRGPRAASRRRLTAFPPSRRSSVA